MVYKLKDEMLYKMEGGANNKTGNVDNDIY